MVLTQTVISNRRVVGGPDSSRHTGPESNCHSQTNPTHSEFQPNLGLPAAERRTVRSVSVRLILVNDEPGLFDIPASRAPEAPEALRELPIRPEQIQQIREAFDKAGVREQEERKSLINSVLIRDVTSLRELHAVEVRRILQAIEQRSKPKSTGSAWDDREEDTWIDKL